MWRNNIERLSNARPAPHESPAESSLSHTPVGQTSNAGSSTPCASRNILEHAPKYTPSYRSSGSSTGMSPTPTGNSRSSGPARKHANGEPHHAALLSSTSGLRPKPASLNDAASSESGRSPRPPLPQTHIIAAGMLRSGTTSRYSREIQDLGESVRPVDTSWSAPWPRSLKGPSQRSHPFVSSMPRITNGKSRTTIAPDTILRDESSVMSRGSSNRFRQIMTPVGVKRPRENPYDSADGPAKRKRSSNPNPGQIIDLSVDDKTDSQTSPIDLTADSDSDMSDIIEVYATPLISTPPAQPRLPRPPRPPEPDPDLPLPVVLPGRAESIEVSRIATVVEKVCERSPPCTETEKRSERTKTIDLTVRERSVDPAGRPTRPIVVRSASPNTASGLHTPPESESTSIDGIDAFMTDASKFDDQTETFTLVAQPSRPARSKGESPAGGSSTTATQRLLLSPRTSTDPTPTYLERRHTVARYERLFAFDPKSIAEVKAGGRELALQGEVGETSEVHRTTTLFDEDLSIDSQPSGKASFRSVAPTNDPSNAQNGRTQQPPCMRRNIRIGITGLCSEDHLELERLDQHRARLALYERKLGSPFPRTHFKLSTNCYDDVRKRLNAGKTGLDGIYPIRIDEEDDAGSARSRRALSASHGKAWAVDWATKNSTMVKSGPFPSSKSTAHFIIEGGDTLYGTPKGGRIQLPLPARIGEQVQILTVHLLDHAVEKRQSTREDSYNPVYHWTSEKIILVAADGRFQALGPVYFRAPAQWGGYKQDIGLVGKIILSWAYDHSYPMAPPRSNPIIANPPPAAVRIKYVFCAGGEESILDGSERKHLPLGWKCAFCNLGDLGGEEELRMHYAVYHRGTVAVETGPEETVDGILYLVLQLLIRPDLVPHLLSRWNHRRKHFTPQLEPSACSSPTDHDYPGSLRYRTSQQDIANHAIFTSTSMMTSEPPSTHDRAAVPGSRSTSPQDATPFLEGLPDAVVQRISELAASANLYTETLDRPRSQTPDPFWPRGRPRSSLTPDPLQSRRASPSSRTDRLCFESSAQMKAPEGLPTLAATPESDFALTVTVPPVDPDTDDVRSQWRSRPTFHDSARLHLRTPSPLFETNPASLKSSEQTGGRRILPSSVTTPQSPSDFTAIAPPVDCRPIAGPSRLADSIDPMARYPERAYPNPLRVAGPQMFGRANRWTDWSVRVNPGTLADLMPELDKIYDGGEFRHVMRDQEESNLWMWHHLTDKRKFVCSCWNRWREERGPMPMMGQAEYLKTWVDKYSPIMRRAACEPEFKDMVYVVYHHRLITRRLLMETCAYWDRLRDDERRSRGDEISDDDNAL